MSARPSSSTRPTPSSLRWCHCHRGAWISCCRRTCCPSSSVRSVPSITRLQACAPPGRMPTAGSCGGCAMSTRGGCGCCRVCPCSRMASACCPAACWRSPRRARIMASRVVMPVSVLAAKQAACASSTQRPGTATRQAGCTTTCCLVPCCTPTRTPWQPAGPAVSPQCVSAGSSAWRAPTTGSW